MSYVHYQRDIDMLSSEGIWVLSAGTSGVKAKWSPGMQPVTVRQIAVQHLTTIAASTAPPVISFWKTSTFPVTTSSSWTLIGAITLTTVANQGKVFYKTVTPVDITAPTGILVETSTATTEVLNYKATIFVEPDPDNPANNTSFVASA